MNLKKCKQLNETNEERRFEIKVKNEDRQIVFFLYLKTRRK
jgi:hypothetical protein